MSVAPCGDHQEHPRSVLREELHDRRRDGWPSTQIAQPLIPGEELHLHGLGTTARSAPSMTFLESRQRPGQRLPHQKHRLFPILSTVTAPNPYLARHIHRPDPLARGRKALLSGLASVQGRPVHVLLHTVPHLQRPNQHLHANGLAVQLHIVRLTQGSSEG